MEIQKIVRAWSDVDYRDKLSLEEQSLLPANPAGSFELSDLEMDNVAGGTSSIPIVCSDIVSICASTLSCGTCVWGTQGCC